MCLSYLPPAKAAAVTQYIEGTIAGSNTVDALGYFSPAGTDLKGMKFKLYFQYEPTDFKKAGCGSAPGSTCGVYLSRPYTTGSLANFTTAGSMLVSIEINQTRQTFAPFVEGLIYLQNAPGQPGILQLAVDPNAHRSVQVDLSYSSTTSFGAALSPGNKIANTGGSIGMQLPPPGPQAPGGYFQTFTVNVAGAIQ
jgi:hypothetical protein